MLLPGTGIRSRRLFHQQRLLGSGAARESAHQAAVRQDDPQHPLIEAARHQIQN